MRGKKKKGVMVKPGDTVAESAVAAAMLEKLRAAGVKVPAANNNEDSVSMTQSEYTYYSETTNDDTVASKVGDRKQSDVGVSLKDINIEASLEPQNDKKSPTGNFLDINIKASAVEKRVVTPNTSRPISSELKIDVEESKEAGAHLQTEENTAQDDSADMDDDDVDEGLPVSAQKLELNKVKVSSVRTQSSLSLRELIGNKNKASAQVEQPPAAQPEASKLNVEKVEQPSPAKKEAVNATAPPQDQKAQVIKQEEPFKPEESPASPFGLKTDGPRNETAQENKPTEVSVTKFEAPTAVESAEEKLADLLKTGVTVEDSNTEEEKEAEIEPMDDSIALNVKKISKPIA